MKILVYGAGVLGSYLAHVLVRGGNDVTVLARGKRAEELKRDGIVIRHYFQLKTTSDRVKVSQTLSPEESYDLIFVVMKFTDFPAVLPVLAENRSSNIVLVGNNTEAHQMQSYIKEHSRTDKNIAFGFQLSGGIREKDRMVAVRAGGQMVLGSLDGVVPFLPLLDKAFKHTKYKITVQENMDAWLKNHVIPIVPLNFAAFAFKGNFKKLARDKQTLQQIIGAMDEGFKVLEALGYPLIPAAQAKWIRQHRTLVYWFLKVYHRLPVAQKIDGTVKELEGLNLAFQGWKQRANVSTPNWDGLEKNFRMQAESGS
ncbi:ketopantoate reductase family protein [Paenibacillus sp. PK3_47]|uniref:ketopantoate reductase family protein n=1 Tax=Paenibacillus sp. PK3_47 TaxID=2072642 RepID=UPI00201DE49A|nr:2-dehydropantoate 2-reductase N-terminal domain-containing protein [Paenibacillus sp. PK3_47]UQZ32218.1 ketopantoate reductase family protein [Paenibacillus sp. PK3_47]